jgi:hypothetical protein
MLLYDTFFYQYNNNKKLNQVSRKDLLMNCCNLLIRYTMSIPIDINFNESPNYFMVLDAVSRGINNLDKICKATKLQKDEVELVINDLLMQRLIVKIEKKGLIFGKKKMETDITQIGIKLLNEKKQELEKQKQQMQQSYNNGDATRLQSYMESNRMWIPMMLFSGIMDMMFFTSIMSFMGISMNPMESALIGGDNSNQDIGTNADGTYTVADQSGASGELDNNISGYDYDNVGYDGFDYGGGFDSF